MLVTLLSRFFSEFIQHESDSLTKVLQKLEYEYSSWVMCHLQKAMLLWMMDAAQRDAKLLYEAMQGIGTRDSALVGIICSRTPSQLYAIKQAYHTMYRRTLEHHIDGDTSGDYRKVSERNKNLKFTSMWPFLGINCFLKNVVHIILFSKMKFIALRDTNTIRTRKSAEDSCIND